MGLNRRKVPLAFVMAMIFAISGLGGVLANHDVQNPLIGHIVVNTPLDDISSCVDAVTSSDISFTNVADPTDSEVLWRLKGQVIISYLTDGEPVIIPGGLLAIDHIGDLFLTLSYPPVSEWPIQSNGTAEIHVDVQLEVLDQNGFMVGHIGLGPGHDWDVFCLTPPPPPTGGQGCTPGYWKNHLSAWADAGYSPNDSFDAVFGVTSSTNPSLQQAINTGGGGEEALYRHATAALLNAAISGVAYDYTVAEVISMVQGAYASGDFESIKNLFEAANESGCSLEGYENTTGDGQSSGGRAKIEKKNKK
jgi:hypothetical protein